MDYAFLKLKTAWGYAKLERKLEVFKQAFYVYFEETYGRPYVPTGLDQRTLDPRVFDPKRFDPNQPRVPAGNGIFSGRWTKPGGGGAGSGSANDGDVPDRIQLAQVRRGGRSSAGTIVQRFIRRYRQSEAHRAIERVREVDPGWRPSESVETPDSIEGQIARFEGQRDEANARWRELAQQDPNTVIETFRLGHGLDLFGQPNLSPTKSTIAHCSFDDQTFMGVNSRAIVNYTQRDDADAKRLLGHLIERHPTIMKQRNIGYMPNNAVFHAETTCLLRAARANGGTLAGKTIDVTVDREMCRSCEAVLPYVGLELGNPIVRFFDLDGNVVAVMRDGQWLD